MKVESVCACKHCLQLKPKDVMSAKDKKKRDIICISVTLHLAYQDVSVKMCNKAIYSVT